MKRIPPSQAPKKGAWDCPDPDFRKSHPLLSQGLCDPWWDDGKSREPWSYTVKFQENGVQVAINDKEGHAGAYTNAGTVAEALTLIEAALADGTLAWRKWKK